MKLMAIDGNSLINRAFYGVGPLTTKEGLPTNAVFGFLNTLQKLIDEHKPQGVCVCFDVRAKTFRHIEYTEYKAQRKGMPEELAVQMPYIKELLDAMGISRIEREGFEADDLIGTLTKNWGEQGDTSIVVTGDRDSLQLVDSATTVSIVSTKMGQTTSKNYDVELFKAEYSGLMPERIVDLKAIMGDKSDNIPGVAGIGEKGAMDLLVKFSTLTGVYQNLESDLITKGTKRKLEDGKDMAILSYHLATIKRDVELQAMDYSMGGGDPSKLYTLLARLELFSLIKKMGLKPSTDTPSAEMVVIDLPPHKVIDDLHFTSNTLGIALEGDVIALSDGVSIGILLPENPRYKELVCQIFSDKYNRIIHDSKAVLRWQLSRGEGSLSVSFDTAIAQYLLAPSDSSYPLEKAVLLNFGQELKEGENPQLDLFSNNQPDYSLLGQRSFFTHMLYQKLLVQLKENGLEELFYNIEMPLVPVLAKMEHRGIICDTQALEEYGRELSTTMDRLSASIYELAGVEFNIGSPKQLGEVLFGKMGLKGGKKTKTGYSTDADSLERLRNDDNPIVEMILNYRKYSKLKSTYCDGLVKVTDKNGRIHTTFNQLVTATGRLSSQDPNLQNIPIRTKDGENIRRAFKAKEGCTLVDADYSQIELRVLAHLSGDTQLIAAFKGDLDVHTATAAQVFNVEPDRVTPLMRRSAKAVNFGIVYGISAFSLADDIGVPIGEAQGYIDSYFKVYHGVKAYMDAIRAKAYEEGQVTTMYGRRRMLPELKAANFNMRSFGERIALNMPVQGAAADIMKIAMIRVENRLDEEGLSSEMLLQVHDELVIECPDQEVLRVMEIVAQEMENAASLSVPLRADVHSGKNWLEAK